MKKHLLYVLNSSNISDAWEQKYPFSFDVLRTVESHTNLNNIKHSPIPLIGSVIVYEKSEFRLNEGKYYHLYEICCTNEQDAMNLRLTYF